MPEETEDPRLTTRLDSIIERLRRLELQMNRISESTTVEAQDFVVMVERGEPRARFEMPGIRRSSSSSVATARSGSGSGYTRTARWPCGWRGGRPRL